MLSRLARLPALLQDLITQDVNEKNMIKVSPSSLGGAAEELW